jgi:hypothetical protein
VIVEIVMEATVQWVEDLVLADRRMLIDSVTTALGCSWFSIQHDA